MARERRNSSAIQFPEGLAAIQKLGTGADLPYPRRSKWLIGFSMTGTMFPPELVFRQFSQGKQPGDLQLIWLGLLLRCLYRNKVLAPPTLSDSTYAALTEEPLRLEKLFAVIQGDLAACFAAIDKLDSSLARSSSWVFVNYDELDRVSAGDWAELRTILRGLVQFWSSYARRWKRLRPKIFLRRDLFDRVALFGPDVSKIAWQRVELVWTTRNLDALTAKRIVNQGDLFKSYFEATLPGGEKRADLGWYPTEENENGYRRFIERLCGKFMGAIPTKGQSFTWIPNHFQDGNGRVLPRSMVRLFETAAEIERENQKADWPRLCITLPCEAVDQVSVSRVQEIEDEEFPWMRSIRDRLASPSSPGSDGPP